MKKKTVPEELQQESYHLGLVQSASSVSAFSKKELMEKSNEELEKIINSYDSTKKNI